MRAAAGAHHVGIAHDDAHALGGNVEQIGHHLRKARFVALARRLGADDDIDMGRSGLPVRLHLDARLFARRTDRGFDIVR